MLAYLLPKLQDIDDDAMCQEIIQELNNQLNSKLATQLTATKNFIHHYTLSEIANDDTERKRLLNTHLDFIKSIEKSFKEDMTQTIKNIFTKQNHVYGNVNPLIPVPKLSSTEPDFNISPVENKPENENADVEDKEIEMSENIKNERDDENIVLAGDAHNDKQKENGNDDEYTTCPIDTERDDESEEEKEKENGNENESDSNSTNGSIPAIPQLEEVPETEQDKEKSKIRYTCSYCNKGFYWKCEMDNHAKIHLKQQLRPYPCVICPLRFLRSHHLSRHINAVHKKLKPHKCHYDGCNQAFPRKESLKRHIDNVHKLIKRWQCRICLKKFHDKRACKKHEKKCGFKVYGLKDDGIDLNLDNL